MRILIDHQCPQCGAPSVLEETDRLFSCHFCRVKSFLHVKDHFRYILPNKAPANQELFYFPYWRFKGMLFSCTSAGIREQFIDVSYQAIDNAHFPVSVGLRSQALKMRFATSDTQGIFLEPQYTADEIIQIFENRFTQNLPKPIYHQEHIGESLSIVYSPFYLSNRLYDAVLDEPLPNAKQQQIALEHFSKVKPNWPLNFLPTLCPGCGWDMQGNRDALALICRNCNSGWLPVGKKFRRIKTGYLRQAVKNPLHLPFWRIKANVDGIDLQTYADLVKVANLPKTVQDEWHQQDFYFWIPAFKLRPRVFMQLANSITLSQPPEKHIAYALPSSDPLSVTLPVTEAIESLKINLACFMRPQIERFPELGQIHINPQQLNLIYIPFSIGHHEYVQPTYQVAINKNLVSLSKNLI